MMEHKHLKSEGKLKVKATQCLTLSNTMNYIVHGIIQARVLEWVALPFSRESSQPRDQKPTSSSLQADSLSTESQGKLDRKIAGVHDIEPTLSCFCTDLKL